MVQYLHFRILEFPLNKLHFENTRSVWPQLESPPHITFIKSQVEPETIGDPWDRRLFWETPRHRVGHFLVHRGKRHGVLDRAGLITVTGLGSGHVKWKHIIPSLGYLKTHDLLGGWALPLWKIWVRQLVSWDDEIPNWMEKSSKCSKAPVIQNWS